MKSTTLTIRFNDTERELYKSYADFKGVALSTLIKNLLSEHIEEEIDKKLYEKAVQTLEKKNQTISFEQLKQEFLYE